MLTKNEKIISTQQDWIQTDAMYSKYCSTMIEITITTIERAEYKKDDKPTQGNSIKNLSL